MIGQLKRISDWLPTWFHSWYMYHVFDQIVPSTHGSFPQNFNFPD